MTISHRVTHSRSSGSSVARENTTVDHNEPADPFAADERRGHLRDSAELPPIIPNEQDRPLIEPQGNS